VRHALLAAIAFKPGTCKKILITPALNAIKNKNLKS
jgi:hypothetical protein